MKIGTTPLEAVKPLQGLGNTEAVNGEATGFADFLKNAINEVNALQQHSAAMKEKLVLGEIDNIHQVMIAAEKANLSFQLTLQIRNKVVEAYQEIMRMQV